MEAPRPTVVVNVRLLPFAHAMVEMRGSPAAGEEQEENRPVTYAVPTTTGIDGIQITFGGVDYDIPRTTGGLM